MEINTYIAVWNYVVVVRDSQLNVYDEWEKFIQRGIAGEKELSERKEIFVDVLVSKGKVGLPSESEVIPSEVPSYFGWHNVPTGSEMNALHQVLTDAQWEAMSIYDRELFATGYTLRVFKNVGFSADVYYRWVADIKAGDMESKKITIFRSWMEKTRDAAIAKQGFAIQNVFSNEPADVWHTYSYTIGTTAKLGCDVVIVNAGKGSGDILANITTNAIKEGGFKEGEVFTIGGYTIAGSDMRAMVKEITLESPTAQGMNGALNAGMTKVMQVFIGDKNNILPDEAGYDTSFVQELNETDPVA